MTELSLAELQWILHSEMVVLYAYAEYTHLQVGQARAIIDL